MQNHIVERHATRSRFAENALNPLIVDERAIRAREVHDLDVCVAGFEPAVHARHEGDVEDEVHSLGSPDRLDRAGSHAKSQGVRVRLRCPKDPHEPGILTCSIPVFVTARTGRRVNFAPPPFVES